MVVYFSFGTNYRKRKLYNNKLIQNDELSAKLTENIKHYSEFTIDRASPNLAEYKELALMLLNDTKSPVTINNHVELLVNGEKKFPDVMEAIKAAKHHIHIEYYIYDDDETGQEIADLLIEKVSQGVQVRFIYDDFGSRSIRRHMVKKLRDAGVEIYPFHKIIFIAFANRLNYRNHRKIVVIDGQVAFVGGINVSDKYVNTGAAKKLFWRDTHLRIEGPGVRYLQYLFLSDWSFCTKEKVDIDPKFFPSLLNMPQKGNKIVQIASSGPDSDIPTILFSLLQGINLAEEELLITTPYFIPGDSIKDSMMAAALGGVKIKLIVPLVSDSSFVNAAARSHYEELLKAGVEIYMYRKGFIHAKTMVIDRKVAIVGSANMDFRSFDLNFEVNAIVYNSEIAEELAQVFQQDLLDADQVDAKEWQERPMMRQLADKMAGLFSPLL